GNFQLGIAGFVPGVTGTYYVRLTDYTTTDYLFTLVRDGVLDQEPNDTRATAQPLGAGVGAVGAVGAGDEDWYTFTVPAGGTIYTLKTATPGGGPGEPVNN